MAGVDLVAVEEFLGHRDIETTPRYAHLATGHLQEAVNRGCLFGTGNKTEICVNTRIAVLQSTSVKPIQVFSTQASMASIPHP
ncbi:hypothetical protein E6H32_10725 [Candidatus Bathyarchaeota archaeon]|nr:MAG: hypothetical protein E6K62_03345 [Nitrospirota bacterium]TMI16655.1 MAG: hypothetical protein E6H32_10725 [Candidatus Bathyarchaeota archaeon]